MVKKVSKEIIIFLLIFLVAIFFRFWKLNSLPPGLYPDVAINGNDAIDSLMNKNFKVFYPENNGREGMMIWLIAISFLIFGKSVLAIKLVAAIFGTMTVFITFLLAKDLSSYLFQDEFDKKLFSFFTTISLAANFWHINFSRIGFRAILLPFFLSLGFYFLLKSTKNRNLIFYILSGIFIGLGIYTYTSYRMTIFVLIVYLFALFLIFKKEKNLSLFFKISFFFILSLLITTLSFFIYIYYHPEDFIGRASQVMIFSDKNPIKSFFLSFLKTLGMFLISGDQNWRHNLSGKPELLPILGVFMFFGIFYSIYAILKSIKSRDWEIFLIHSFLISWFFFLLAGSFLTKEGIPHALRAIGVIPVVFIFSGLGLIKFLNYLKLTFEIKKIIIFIFSLVLIFYGYYYYFILWGKSSELKGAFSQRYLEIGEFLNNLSESIEKYVIVNQGGVPVPYPNGLPMPVQTPIFIERTKYENPRAIYLLTEDLNQIKINKKTIIIPLECDENLLHELSQNFPGGKIVKNDICFYEVNGKNF